MSGDSPSAAPDDSGAVPGLVVPDDDRSLRADDRAVSAVVGKTLEAGIVVLYIGLLVSVLYGGAVPEYRAAAGDELGERVLAEATLEVESAVPVDPAGESTVRIDLPDTIRGSTYAIEADGDELVLDHPHPSVGGELPLALPSDVDRVDGEFHSTDPGYVVVERTGDGRVVRLERDAP